MATWGWPFSKAFTGQYEEGQQFGMTTYDRGGGVYFHDGFDFGTAIYGASSKIKAVHDGTVIYAGADKIGGGSLGNNICIQGGGYYFVYQEFSFNTSDISVKTGDTVKTGDVIGTLSEANGASHLHLGITKKDWLEAQSSWDKDDGTWLDPIKLIKAGIAGDDNNPDDNPEPNSTSAMLGIKVNQFRKPIRKVKNVDYATLLDNGKSLKFPKYESVRFLINRSLKSAYPDIFKKISALQGEYGLEKLACAPFTTITLTNGKGVTGSFNLANFRNQSKPIQVFLQGFLGFSNRVEFGFEDYLNYFEEGTDGYVEAARRKDSLTDMTPKNFELIIDTSAAYEYQNQNRIKQSYDNASFQLSQNSIVNGNDTRNFKLSQDNQLKQMEIQRSGQMKALDLTQSADLQKQLFRSAPAALSSGLQAADGNFMGALTTGLGVVGDFSMLGMQHNLQNQQLAQQQNTAAAAMHANMQTSSKTFYNNLTTNQLIASNNYENAVANINAGLQDLKIQPDITAVSGSDYNFELGFENDSYFSILYTTNPQALLSLAYFFAQFGYAINQYDKIENYLNVRKSFNYIKTQGANIQGDIPTKYKNSLNLIFDNGITFWNDTEKMATGDITGNEGA